MKKYKNRIIVMLCCTVTVVALAGWAISAEWSHTPIYRSGNAYILRDTYNNHMGTVSLEYAQKIHINQNGMYEIWQYEECGVEPLLDALAWRQNNMADTNEVAQFAISFSKAENDYLPQDRTQETYYFSTENHRTHDYVHLYFYPEVTMGNGEHMQNLLLIMREY